jgi:membrane protease YdiL (CAAX protease family)
VSDAQHLENASEFAEVAPTQWQICVINCLEMESDTRFGDTRHRNLAHVPRVAAITVLALGIFAAGEWWAKRPYTDPHFVVDFLGTELAVALLLVLATLLWLPARQLGLRWPTWRAAGAPGPVWPVLTLTALVALAWGVARLSLPEGAPFDASLSWPILRTTLLVGFNEEWLFRGLLLAAACRWWGLRRGAAAALLAFGLFHLLNLVAGVPLALAPVQVVSTIVLGAIFLMGALATRSLLLPMGAHALYDFVVMDLNRLSAAGGSPWVTPALMLPAYAMGLYCLWRLWRLPEGELYPD